MRRAVPRITALLAAALLLTACVPAAATGSADSPYPAALPDGVRIAIYQSRSDVAPRRLEISVTNDGERPLDVTAVRFAAPQFAGPAVWPKDGTTVHPGTAVDLPVSLPPADCSRKGASTVTLRFRGVDGREREATVRPDDRFDRLPALRAEDCLAEAVAALATIGVSGPLRVADVGGVRTVTLDVVVEPTGGGGSLTLDSVAGTTLLAPAAPDTGARLEQTVLATRVDADAGPRIIPLTFVPNRCDAHAIAEDKRGTILPLGVTIGTGARGIVPVAADPETRSALQAFVAEACGLP
jgi:hypothetical protein